MPLEIKELHIKVTVNQPESGGQATAGPSTSGNDDDKEGIIRQCIEQVIDLIEAKKER